jgi:hypothetical protein
MPHALSTTPGHGVRNTTAAVLVAWFLLALGCSLLGVFDNQPGPPVLLGLAVLAPLAVFGACYLTSAPFRQFVSSLDLRVLTLLHTLRVVGVVFVLLYHQGALPGVFALPAGWGDIAIGITAPLVAWYWKPPFPTRAFVVWNVLGSLDLVLAISLGVLSSPTPVGILAGDVTTRLLGQFPLSLIPTFFVPLLLICHLICLIRVRQGMPEEKVDPERR